MRNVVVVGDPEEVETRLCRRAEHLGRPRVPIRVERMAVKIPSQPTGAGVGKGIRIDAARDAACHLPGRPKAGVEPDLHFPIASARSDLVWAEEHVPRARADLPPAVGRRGPDLVDRELHLVASAPAAEAGASFGGAALVEEPDVQRVAAGDRRVRVDLIAVRVTEVQLPQARRDLERYVRVPALVVLLESTGQNDARSTEIRVSQFNAAPLDASKTRTAAGCARRKTRVPGSGRTSGPVRTFNSTSPSFTLTMTSLPSGSETSTSAGCAPPSRATISSSMASGRRPARSSAASFAMRGASMRHPPSSSSEPFSWRAATMFIGGLPMNWATKRFAGR